MRLLFVMDPPERIGIHTDTTFVFMMEAQRRGHELLHADASTLAIDHRSQGESHVTATARPARVQAVDAQALVLGAPVEVDLASCDAVLMRRDPPYDLDYYFATLLLERARAHTLVLNDPRGLREANEKLYAMNFPEFIPATVVTRDAARLRAMQTQMGGELIVKPLDGCGGRGVFHLSGNDRNIPSILETITDFGRRWVIGQQYLPAARQGDKRILLLDGQVIGQVLRVPREDEVRGNLHVGGRAARSPLTEREQAICRSVGPRLRADGLWFVGIDVIGDYLTEVNVTSPTGVQEVNALEGVQLERAVIDSLEARVRARAC
jgi:glutathione synthase